MADLSELSKQAGSPPAARPSRLPTLTGTRMIAATIVFLLHASIQGFFSSPEFGTKLTSVVYQGAWATLTFFFVLSGFVLTWAARPTDTTRSYLRRRILKLYPNHIMAAAVAVLLMFFVVGRNLGTYGDTPGPVTVVLNFLLIQAWSPDWMVRTALNPPAWSLACELLFYLAFPVLYALIKRIRPERLWAWTTGVATVAVIGVPVIAATLVPHQVISPQVGLSDQQFWFIVQFPPTRALEFMLGMLLARIVLSRRRLPISVGGAMALVVGAYAFAPLFPTVFSNNALMLIPVALLIARMAVADSENKRTWLSSKVMVRLGDISFAFYVWHQVVLMYGHYWLGETTVYSTPVAIAVIVGLFAIALALAYLQFTFVENPIMRKWSGPRRKRPVLEPVAAAPPSEADGPAEIKRAS